MRKAIEIAVLAAFILSFSGCANTENPHTAESSSQETVSSGIIQSTEPEESSAASVSESKESSEKSTPPVKAETVLAEILPPAAAESSEAARQAPTTDENRAPTPAPLKTVEPTPEPKPTPPHAEEKPMPEPAPTEPPQESTPPDEPTVPEFNIQTWIDYAKAYAVNVGLRLESTAVDCWDNPITAGAYSSCLERDIQNRLNRYSRDEDITDVWIWAEERSDGSYDLYIGYA